MTAAEAFTLHLNRAEQCAKAGDKRESEYHLMLAEECAPWWHNSTAHHNGRQMLADCRARCAVILRGRAASSWGRIARNGAVGFVLALLVIFLWMLTQLP